MIALLEGALGHKAPDQVLVKVGGVGYQVFIPLSTFYALPEPPAAVSLHIHTHVSSDSLQLFGFLTPEEKDTFLLLLTIPRIGPRLALNILSGISPRELALALAEGDLKRLVAIPGLGRKSAERLLVELKGKLAPPAAAPSPTAAAPNLWDDALSALVNLGYTKAVAEKVLHAVQAQGEAHTLEDILRLSLGRLGL